MAPRQERHLAHETWHVVQQARGKVVPTGHIKNMLVNDAAKLEQEADIMGGKIALYTQGPQKFNIMSPNRSSDKTAPTHTK